MLHTEDRHGKASLRAITWEQGASVASVLVMSCRAAPTEQQLAPRVGPQLLLLPSPEKKTDCLLLLLKVNLFFFFPMIYKSMEQELGIRWISLVLILMYAEARMPSDRVSAVWAPALSVTWISITRALLLQGQVQSLSTLQLTQATNHRMFPLNM